MSDPAGYSTSPTVKAAFAPFTRTSFRRYRKVMMPSAPFCLTTVIGPVPVTVPALTTSAVSSVAGASRIVLSSIVFTSMLLAIPIVQALSS
jgi:hypothetical protein